MMFGNTELSVNDPLLTTPWVTFYVRQFGYDNKS